MNIALLELLIVTAAVMGLGLWQLWDVNRELKKHDDNESGKPDGSGRDGDGERPD